MKYVLNILLKQLGLKVIRINGAAAEPKELICGMERAVARKFFWTFAFHETQEVSGSIAEFGVGAGSGVAYWLNLIRQYGGGNRFLRLTLFRGFRRERLIRILHTL
jgi:hypothetical protein